MNTINLEEIKRKLEGERTGLLATVKKDESVEDFGSDLDHSDEESNEAESIGNHLAEAQDLKERINEIDAALNKIRTGKYGICERCGKKIDEEVLKVVPESRFCKNCKKKAE